MTGTSLRTIWGRDPLQPGSGWRPGCHPGRSPGACGVLVASPSPVGSAAGRAGSS